MQGTVATRSEVTQIVDRFSLADTLDGRHHSRDFSGSRADLVSSRVKIMAILFAVATPAWIPVDFYTMPFDQAMPLAALRGIAGLLFAGVYAWPTHAHDLIGSRIRILGLIAVGVAFYVATRILLNGGLDETGVLAGYTYLPLVLIVLLATIPLTAFEGFVYASTVGIAVIAVEFSMDHLFSVDALGYLWLMGILMSIGILAQTSQLHMLLQLYRQATRDSLTGLFNRRHLVERFEQEVTRAHRYARELSVILLDIDRFKRVNDTYGHLVGDEVLRELSAVIDEEVRTTDVVGRYGGEEFLILLPDTGPEGAVNLAERMRKACKRREVANGVDVPINFTVSLGVTSLTGGDDTEALFARVDSGLYKAKGGGRDRVVEVVAESGEDVMPLNHDPPVRAVEPREAEA